jgi:hypothetical protein
MWSSEFITNPEQAKNNSPLKISATLEKKLKAVRETFAKSLLADKDILYTVLRPNLDAMIIPLLEARKTRKLKTVIIYSNTGVTYSTELAKYLIESLYNARGFFSLLADHWHPLRDEDRKDERPGVYVEPYKTIGTLQKLFAEATHTAGPVPLNKIMFVDDRQEKHRLTEQEGEGLTYLKPTRFVPKITDKQRDYMLFLALMAMNKHGVLDSTEYMESAFCHRDIPYEFTKKHLIRGFPDLVEFIMDEIWNEEGHGTTWKADTAAITSVMKRFLNNV